MKTCTRGFIGLVLSLTFAASTAYSATNYYVSTTGNDGNDGLTPGTAKLTIQAAVGVASATDIINVDSGIYEERVVLDKSLTLQGAGESMTVLDGSSLAGAGSGVTINSGITNVTIQNMTIRNYAGTSPNSYAGIYAIGSNNALAVQNVTLQNNVGGSGFYANGPVNGVTLDNLDVSGHTNAFGAARGIVIWNGLKENITITNCDVYNNNCCGIELQDGTASGVTMTGNNIHDNGDNGIGLVGLQGPGENLVKLNTVKNNGRFGIEIKNPNGSGLAAGAGRVVVENNTVQRTSLVADARDIAGIAAFRRGVLAGNVDVPNGVVIQNNIVSGYSQPSASEGFGIVAEGTNHTVSGNTVSGCDVGIQRQVGNGGYPGDGNQNNIADQYFGRGNSQVTCGITIGANTLANTTNLRDVPVAAGNAAVVNANSLASFCTIQAAVNAASPGDVINVGAGTFNERVTIDKSLTLNGASEATTILTGTGLAGAGSGIVINAGVTNVTIQNLTVRNYAGTSPNSYAGIYGTGSNNGLNVQNVTLKDNVGGSGFYANGPVNGVTLNNLDVSGHTNAFGAARGIVIWNGLKENITITNCDVYGNNCCGVELQDGTASGVTMTGNNIHDNGDNGIGVVGLQGPGENLIKLNTVTNNGRFGIEVKNPNGSGQATGPGRVVVEDNTVSRTLAIGDARDIAGIAAFRRGVLAGNVDVPNGVVIRNNNVSGYVQPSTSEGFGIVAEGMNHSVTGNTVNGCDVGIQRQAGHTPYPGDGNQNDLADQYFGRGNSPVSCGITVSGNTFGNVLANTTDTRDVPLSAGGSGVVVNTTTLESFCTIQAAINDANTLSGHTLEVGSGTYDEQVLVTKGVTIKGVGAPLPTVDFTGTVSGDPTLFRVSADGVTIESVHFNVDLAKLKSAIIASAVTLDNITVKNNTIDAYNPPSAGTYGNRNAVSVNYGGPTNYRNAAGGVDNVVFTGNVVNGTLPSSFFRAALAVDEGGVTFTGNTSRTINHDVLVRFGNNGPVTITNNQLNGGGVELAEMNAGAGTLTVSNNTFDATFANSSAPGTAVLRLKNNNAGKTTIVDGNTFMNHEWAVSTENYNNVTISNNLMTPLASSTTFHHVTVNTKSISTNSASIVQVPVAAQITNNFFNGSGNPGGSGVTFLNHDSDAAAFGALEVHQNSFDFSIANAIEQDGQSGNTTGSTFPNYNLLIGGGAGGQTTMAPWTAAIDGTCNWYGTTNAATIASRVGPNVAEVPFLASGVDDQPGTFGFQPATTTSTALVSDNNPATYGTKITFTATVTPAVESGTIELFDGAISLGIQNAAGGVAVFSVDTLHNGSHTITAVYSGDACYATSTSDPLAQSVVDQTNPVANVTLPTTNDVLVVGSHAKIQWTASDDKGVESVSIILSRDNGATWEDIVLDIANTGTYTWVVTGPPTGPTAKPVYSAIIQVKAKDAAGNVGTGTSGTFAIYDLTTDALLSTFQADPVEDGIELRWQFGSSVSISGVTLERASSSIGPWSRVVAEARHEGGMTVVLDRTAEPGQTYYYRLQVSLEGGRTISFGPLAGTLGDRIAAFALTSITPNPTVDFARIDYAVPRESRVRLSVIDVQGREVALLVDGVVRAGRFQTTWNGQLQSGVAAPAGLYFVRMNSGGKDYVRRLALSR